MQIKTEEFLLPVYWASYLINGDATGYEDDEFEEIEEWVTCNAPGPCLDVGEASFCWRGDDSTQGADRAVFTFQVIEPVLADGEVVSWT